jgi:hypothetical protein
VTDDRLTSGGPKSRFLGTEVPSESQWMILSARLKPCPSRSCFRLKLCPSQSPSEIGAKVVKMAEGIVEKLVNR